MLLPPAAMTFCSFDSCYNTNGIVLLSHLQELLACVDALTISSCCFQLCPQIVKERGNNATVISKYILFLKKTYFIVFQLKLSAFTPHHSPLPSQAIPTSLPCFHPTLVLSMCPLQLFLKALPPLSLPTSVYCQIVLSTFLKDQSILTF